MIAPAAARPDALGPLAQAPLPAAVRADRPEDVQAYRSALGFERELLTQLLGSMTGGEGEGGAATAMYRDMLPGQMADAVAGAGGLGLAEDLFKSLRGIG